MARGRAPRVRAHPRHFPYKSSLLRCQPDCAASSPGQAQPSGFERHTVSDTITSMRHLVMLCLLIGCTSKIRPPKCTIPCAEGQSCPEGMICGGAGVCEPATGPSCLVDAQPPGDGPIQRDSASVDSTSSNCPDTWGSFGQSCYRLFNNPYNAEEANQFCNSLTAQGDPNPHLVVIESEAENDWLTTTFLPGDQFTIGLFYDGADWTWVTGDVLSGYNGFDGGVPPSAAGATAVKVGLGGLWTDNPLASDQDFLCEFDGQAGTVDPPGP